jgi:hypothetical protein
MDLEGIKLIYRLLFFSLVLMEVLLAMWMILLHLEDSRQANKWTNLTKSKSGNGL